MSDNISTRVFTSYTNKDGCIVQNVWKIKEGYFISVFFFGIAALSTVQSHACRVDDSIGKNIEIIQVMVGQRGLSRGNPTQYISRAI